MITKYGKKNIRMTIWMDYKRRSFQEVGAFSNFFLKSPYIKLFLRNLVGFRNLQPFVLKDHLVQPFIG